jgi:hypothetical protein
MSLLGQGIAAIWNDITDEGRANFYEWHNREHIPERLGVEGFLRGRRYVALEGAPEYFTLYEVRDLEVLSSGPYLARLNAPTEWTSRSVLQFRNTARSLCRMDTSLGAGSGGYLATLRFDCDPERDAALLERLTRTLLPTQLSAPAIVAAHVGRADLSASTAKTAEQRGRPENAVPRWVIMIEATTPEAAEAAVTRTLGSDALAEPSITGDARGLYQLQFDLLGSAAGLRD